MTEHPIPTPTHEVTLKRMLPILQETINHCIEQALIDPSYGGIDFDESTNEMIYYCKPSKLDRDLFELLIGIEEVWVVTRGSKES